MKKISKLIYFILLAYTLSNITGCNQSKIKQQEKMENLYPPESAVISYHSDWTKNHYPERIKAFKQDPLHEGDIVFIGDSYTEWGNDWSAQTNVANIKNRGIAGDVTDGVLQRLEEITYFKPGKVFILIGTNDLFNIYYQKQIPSAAYVGNNILKIAGIIHQKTPETKIYIQTVLPSLYEFMKEYINQVNVIIKAPKTEKTYEVIDLNAAFLDAAGLMRKDLTADGIHLNDAGYAVWADVLKPYLISK